jgi:hypothetical protein
MFQKSFITIIVIMLFVTATTSFAADKYQWKLVDTENNCQLYTSNVAGKEYIAAKTTCIIPARIETIGMVIKDVANFPKWMEDCAETKILKVYDPENDLYIFWYHQHVVLKTDRDMVLKSRVNPDLKQGKITIYADSTNEIPYDAGKGYIRMPSFSSVWTLEWVDRDREKTRVTLMIDPDLGAGLPKFIANRFIQTNPYKTLQRMMKVVKDPKYIEEGKKPKYSNPVEEAIKAGYVKP